MAQLKVTAYKKSGKYYCNSQKYIKSIHYTTFTEFTNNESLGEMRDKQINQLFDLAEKIKRNDSEVQCYSPVKGGFDGFVFVIEGLLDNSEFGFINFILDRIGEIQTINNSITFLK